MPNVAPFLPDRGVAHGMCGGTELYSQRVCFEGLRLASVKWDKKICVEFTNTKLWLNKPQTLSHY